MSSLQELATAEVSFSRSRTDQITRWFGPHPLLQILLIVALLALLVLAIGNVVATMQRQGIEPGFGFLFRSANFEIGETSLAFQAGNPYWLAISVGLINTLKVAVAGIVLATILGVLVGIGLMLRNPLLGGLLRAYIEIIRNTPLLLQLFFWLGLVQAFPPPKRALSAFGSFYLTNRGVYVPALQIEFGRAGLLLLVAALVGAILWWRHKFVAPLQRWGSLLLGALLLAIVLKLAGVSFELEQPQLSGFNMRGGHVLTPEFAALLIGLTVKFSATIAEIVRAGIQSVRAGQWEAARALGLRDGQIFRLVVLPQALRVITPLTTSTYLDLIKDSSLAVAIGYPDLVSIINTTANTTGQSLEALAILVVIYLLLNLSVSLLMNIYNRRVALRGEGLR